MYLRLLVCILVIACVVGIGCYCIPPSQPNTILIKNLNIKEHINDTPTGTDVNGICIYKGSYTPAKGDVILYGHRTMGDAPFYDLDLLNKGDMVKLVYDNHEYTYIIQNKKVFSDSDIHIRAHRGGDDLYLITCDPKGSGKGRLICKASKQ